MTTLAETREMVRGLIKDDGGRLQDPSDYDRNIDAAIGRYSKHRPDEKIEDIVGDGTHDYDLPSSWIAEFSTIRGIEYPIGDIPATMLDSDSYEIYKTPTGNKIRLKDNAPSASESFRITYTILRTAATVPDGDISAFVWLATSLCCEELANAYAQTSDSTISADSVNYRTKSQEFASRAKRLKVLYAEHMGLKDGDLTPPASAVVDMDIKYPGGGRRLTHPRAPREKR
jgi:hypothetical protein